VNLDAAERYLGDLDVVLMMTVRPGFGGQKFLEEVVPKIAAARDMVDRAGANADIEVDGGVNLSTVDRAVTAGGDILVAGSAVFDGVDAPAAATRMRERLDKLGHSS
jgi:ribulose-phosphate 3-epimerase